MDFTRAQADALRVNPDALKAQIEANPFALLPALTAPDRLDYAADAEGETAYQQAVDLYNQKTAELSEAQSLYAQYQDYLQNLPEPTYNGPGHGTDPQPSITGSIDPDANAYYPNSPYLNAAAGLLLPTQESGASVISGLGNLYSDAITESITGGEGADAIEGHAVVGIQLHGGAGGDWIRADEIGVLYSIYTDPSDPNYRSLPQPGPGAYLYGNAGHDFLQGGLRDDTIDGGDGGDWAEGYTGEDTLQGGFGIVFLDNGVKTEHQRPEFRRLVPIAEPTYCLAA